MNKFKPAALLVWLVPCLLFFLVYKCDKRKGAGVDREFDKMRETVCFEGEVVSSPVYKYSTLLCIKIDTASVDSFYYFSRAWALCILEGMAVMPIGLVDENDSSDCFKATAHQVIVNKDYGGKMLFVRGNDTLAEELSLWPGKLEEVHLLMAWENAHTAFRQ